MTNFETEMNEKITTIIKEMNIDEQFWLARQYWEDVVDYYNDVDYYDDMPEVVDYIIKNEDALENEDIQEILDRYTRTEELDIERKILIKWFKS